MSDQKKHAFLPLACCAIFSAVTFGGIGVAALTGQIAIAAKKDSFFGGSATSPQKKNAQSLHDSPRVDAPSHVGLTRSAVRDANGNEKPMVVRVSQRFSETLAPTCSRCGVIASIERHELQMPVSRSARGSEFPNQRPDNATGAFANAGRSATSFIVRLRMEDGSLRTIYEHQPPKFSVGERVQLINGSVVSLG